MSTIKSNNENMTINADGASSEVKFQANGVEKASISSAGAFTSTTIDATKLTGNLPAIDGSSLTGVGGGKVLQVVNQNKNSPEYYISTASYTDMFSNSITPTAVGSTFLIFTQINNTRVTSGGDPMRTTLKRGSTEVHTLNTSAGERDNFTDIWLDTTTNADLTARTYTVAGRTTGGGGQSSLQWNRGMFGITIIELGA